MTRVVGVCSWSLGPGSAGELVESVGKAGLRAVQLALDPIRRSDWDEADAVQRFEAAGVTIASGMMAMDGEDYSTLEAIKATGGVRPDGTWPANLAAAKDNAKLAQRLGLDLVTFHAGFIPHDRADAERATMIDRLRQLVDVFAASGMRTAFETGQESADTLIEFLDELDRPTAGVNFDPANMILYGMGDPVDALDKLASRVLQIHIKDANPSAEAGSWGSEVPAGDGAVDWRAFFAIVRDRLGGVDLMIEREAGDDRTADITKARELVARFAPGEGVGA